MNKILGTLIILNSPTRTRFKIPKTKYFVELLLSTLLAHLYSQGGQGTSQAPPLEMLSVDP